MRMPNRDPDFKLDYISFWWEEKIQTNRFMEHVFQVDPVNWTYHLIGERDPKWFSYITFLGEEDLYKVKSAYAMWLLEKEIFR